MKIISIINQKGGVEKLWLICFSIVTAGKNFAIDLDPQGNATTGLGLSNTERSDQTIYGILNGSVYFCVIKKTNFEIGLDIF